MLPLYHAAIVFFMKSFLFHLSHIAQRYAQGARTGETYINKPIAAAAAPANRLAPLKLAPFKE